VLFEKPELERMTGFLGITPDEFVKQYTDPRWLINEKLLLRHQGSDGCVFLAVQGREALCSIHTARPDACRAWIPAFTRRECAAGLGKIWRLTVAESGTLCGEEHDKKAFLDYLKSIAE